MKRRAFTLTAAGAAVLPLGLVPAYAQGAKPVAGVDYIPVEPRAPIEAPAGKIEVVEFFWYGCPHCNAFEPMLAAWIKKLPKDVYFRRVHVLFGPHYGMHQRLFYALDSMQLIDKLHAKVFAAIHSEGKKLDDPNTIADWVAAQGVDRAKFVAEFNSFTVASVKSRRAFELQNAYKIQGVPALGVAGIGYTDAETAQGMERALKVVEGMVTELRRTR